MEGQISIVGERAPDFELADPQGIRVKLSDCLKVSPVMLVFYPADFTPVCTKQLCNYRDDFSRFTELGVRLLAISRNSAEEHRRFAAENQLPFTLLTDPDNRVAKAFRCTSRLLFGQASRGIVIVNRQGFVLYRRVEPTPLTRRKSAELTRVLGQLKEHGLLTSAGPVSPPGATAPVVPDPQ
jgi:peroxiredoxin Q/BCP